MSKIQFTAYLNIHSGKMESFRSLAKKCLSTVKEKDKGTLQYDWFYSADDARCVVREQYDSSDAAMEHMGNVGKDLGELLAISDLRLEVYGKPSDALRAALEGLDAEYFTFAAGL